MLMLPLKAAPLNFANIRTLAICLNENASSPSLRH